MKRKSIFCILLLVSVISLFGQNLPLNNNENTNSSQQTNSYDYAIGLAAGFTTGIGISYRYWPGDWGCQVTFAPYYDSEGTGFISLGTALLRNFYNADWSRLYGYTAAAIFYQKYPNSETVNLNIGIGPGFEIYIVKNVSFNLMFGIGAYNTFLLGTPNTSNYRFLTTVTAETGIFYRF